MSSPGARTPPWLPGCVLARHPPASRPSTRGATGGITVASAEAVTAVVEAGGAHVPGLMTALEQRLRAVAASHGSTLGEHAGATIAAGGKRLRPLLVFVAAGPAPAGRDAALRAAVAVELVHSATLVHDDVLDAAGLRRGRPAVVPAAGGPRAPAPGGPPFPPAVPPPP